MYHIKRMFWLCLMLFVSVSELSAQQPAPKNTTNAVVCHVYKHPTKPDSSQMSIRVSELLACPSEARRTAGPRSNRVGVNNTPRDTSVEPTISLIRLESLIREVFTSLHGTMSHGDSVSLANMLSGSVDVRLHFDDEFYRVLAQALRGGGNSGVAAPQPANTHGFWYGVKRFPRKHPIITTLAVVGTGFLLAECLDGDGCYFMVNRQIVRE